MEVKQQPVPWLFLGAEGDKGRSAGRFLLDLTLHTPGIQVFLTSGPCDTRPINRCRSKSPPQTPHHSHTLQLDVPGFPDSPARSRLPTCAGASEGLVSDFPPIHQLLILGPYYSIFFYSDGKSYSYNKPYSFISIGFCFSESNTKMTTLRGLVSGLNDTKW